MRFLLLAALIAWPLRAADDVDSILKRLIEVERKNGKSAQQYTYVQETERYTYDKDGQAHKTESQTDEVIFVEGLKYEKLVARDGKPLSAREQARVEKNMQQTAAERRKHLHPIPSGGAVFLNGPLSHKRADLGSLSELPTLFENRLTGEEDLRGHHTWVIESTRRPPGEQATEHEKEVLGFRKKFWVDQKDGALVRAIYTATTPGGMLSPGSSLTFEYEKVDQDVWEPVMMTLEFSRAKTQPFKPTGKTVYRMDQFHKFDVQSTITVNSQGK